MEKLFELTFQDQTLNPQVGTFTDVSQTTGTFTLEDGEYYLTNADTKGFYAYSPVAIQSGADSKVIIEFDLKVVTASANTHTIIGTYVGVDGSGIPTGAKITLQYNAGDIELVLGSGTTATLIASVDVVVDQWYHFRIDCTLTASVESTYQVKIDGTTVTTVTGATTDYELGIISVLGTDLHACDECGIKNITFVTETNLYVGRTALDQALQDAKGYVDAHFVPIVGTSALSGSIIPSTDNSYDLGNSNYSFRSGTFKSIYGNDANGLLRIWATSSYGYGGMIEVCGKDYNSGRVRLAPMSDSNTWRALTANANGTLSWSGSPITYTSDYRLKDEIESISDEVLDAWENLEPKQYKYKSDLENDKENAQVHYGWIAQDVESIIKGGRKAEIKNGLWLHEEWEEQEEVSHEEEYQEEVQAKDGNSETVTKTRKVIDTPYRAKGDSYGLRYTECLVVECAYLRKKNKELQEQLDKLSARLDKLEGVQTK